VAAAASADAALVTAALGRMTSVGADVQLRELEMEIDLLLGRHLRAGGGISTAAFQDVAVTAGRFGLRMPRWFGTLARTLLTLEGTLRSIDPSFSLVDAAREAMGGPGREGLGSGSLRDTIQREAMAQLPRLRRLPERVDDLLGRAADGRLSAKVSLFGDPHNEEVVTRLVDRLVLGMIASSVGVGSVLLLGVESGPAISTSVSINEVLGYVGLVSSAVLALRLVAEIIRDGVT
jgi:ubiquinone biosynthesis protein